jgi:hypothetical protein
VRLESTRLCWFGRFPAAAIASKPNSLCLVFVSLTGLYWTRLDYVGVYVPSLWAQAGMHTYKQIRVQSSQVPRVLPSQVSLQRMSHFRQLDSGH